jgi:tetratricopeptide (TPR) repeat protein
MTSTFRFTAARFALLACLVLAAALAPAIAHAQFEEEEDVVAGNIHSLNDEAWSFYLAGDTTRARESWQLVLAIDSQHVSALHGLAQIHFDARRHDSAIVGFRTALRAAPNDPVITSWLAWSLFYMEDVAEAERLARESISLGNTSHVVRLLLARILAQTNRRGEASEVMLRAERYADSASDFDDVGDEYARLRMHEQAAAMYVRAMQLDTAEAIYAFRAGRSLARAGRWRAADSAFVLALAREAPVQPVTRVRYVAAKMRGDESAAAAHRATYGALPPDASIDTLLVDGMAQLGLRDEALALCYAALEKDPSNTIALSRVAEIWNDFEWYHRACREVLRLRDLDFEEVRRLTTRMEWDANAARSCLVYLDVVEGPDTNFVAPAADALWREPATGLAFPARHAAFRRTAVDKAALDELGTTVRYEWDPPRGAGASITVTVTPAPRDCVGPWFVLDAAGRRRPDTTGRGMLLLSEPSASFMREYRALLRETSLRSDKPVLANESRFVASEPRKLIALQADFTIASQAGRMSTALLFTLPDAYVVVDIRRPVAAGFEHVEMQRAFFDMILAE